MGNLKSKTASFLSMLEGYHQVLKELHWSSTNNPEHVLLDEINSAVLSYEDKIAEYVMGKLDVRFEIGDLKSLLPSEKTFKGVLSELEKDVFEFKKVFSSEQFAGLHNILDEFLTNISTWNYLRTLTI